MRLTGQRLLALFVLVIVAAAGCSASTSPQVITATPAVATNAAAPADTAPGVTSTTPTPASAAPDIDAFMRDLMDMYDIPGAGLALVQNGEVVVAHGYGMRSTGTGAPVTPDTLFAIGSVTKSFTALDVMQLVDGGQVALDAPVASYIPAFALSDPDTTQRVTVRDLLAQTSGLPGGDDAAWVSGQVSTLQEAVEYAATLNLAAAPGSAHIYDNFNYAIAGYLVEQVSGQTWEAYTREHVLTPLDVGAAFDIPAMQQAADHAVPHSLDVLEGMQPAEFVSLSGIAPAGALNASARGMANYLLLQLGDGTFGGATLLSPALLDEMHAQQAAYPPQPPIGPTGFQTNGYALGWFTADFNGMQVVWHNGSIDGFYTIVMLVPAQNVGVAVLSNAGLGTGSLFTLAASLGLLEQRLGIDAGRDVVAALNVEASFDPADRRARLDAARSYEANSDEWAALVGDYGGLQVEIREDTVYLMTPQSIALTPYEANGFLAANRSRDGLITTYSFVPGDDGSVALYRDGTLIGQKVSG
ncbi:serine hydrolase domain-containing protein [Aggregatilinea lenta]|uniref:serine hydrolase domain-containing protein n=1 Tax=Aggregatilinea lenta TaxID=913108 RepID=UPI000E5C02C3|nr:serine hydrolase domain-containing protein [Aggregatilinea lenta]